MPSCSTRRARSKSCATRSGSRAASQQEAVMSSDAKAFYDEWSTRMSHAKASAPDAARGFGSLYQAVMKAGAMSVLEKELVALGISMAVRCDGCIYAHAEKAFKAGATRAQIV